jgi:hypothetical protein
MAPTNIFGYIHQWHITDEYIGPGGQGAGLTGGPINSSVNRRIYEAPEATRDWRVALIVIGEPTNVAPYICHLTDEYKSFILFLLPVLAASPNEEPPK